MATDASRGGGGSAFVRASAQRSSLRNTPGSSSNVELARQRALQAAEYYHRAVLGSSPEDQSPPPPHSQPQQQPQVPQPQVDPARSTPTSDAYYKQKLRSGFIDLRNSYNEKRPRKMTAYQGGNHRGGGGGGGGGGGFQRGGVGAGRALPRVKENTPPSRHTRSPPRSYRQSTLAERRGLFRSNSSLELENIDFIDAEATRDLSDAIASGAMQRTYGSTNSLERLSTSGESFFAMLQDYRNDNVDQRAPAPPLVHEVLRGGDSNHQVVVSAPSSSSHPQQIPIQPQVAATQQQQLHSSSVKVSNGAITLTVMTEENVAVSPPNGGGGGGGGAAVAGSGTSPRLKSKSLRNKERKKERAKSVVSEASSGILKKLRGTKSDPNDVIKSDNSNNSVAELNEPLSQEESLRRKAFVHYDCQSVGVDLLEVIKQRTNAPSDGMSSRKNITTGASAASGVKNVASPEEESGDADLGDGKENDLLLSCPYFRNELGSEEERTLCLNRNTAQRRVQQLLGNRQQDTSGLCRQPVCNGLSVLDSSYSPIGSVIEPVLLTQRGLVIEYVDQGATYYRDFFQGFEHQNFFGIDDNLGPVAVSIRREKVEEKERETPIGRTEGIQGPCYQYRVIIRTSELTALRGCILEDAIPSSSRLSNTKGLPAKEVLDYLLPPDSINLACLKLSLPGPKTAEQLIKLDEQGLSKTYKFGVLFCRAGQSSEEDMYNNEHASPMFEEFLNCLGERVRLKGFDKYRGGLDAKTDSTGMHSLFASMVGGYEMMFHVSTMLPYTPNNRQQLLRKRHIGNDIVTIIFQEPDAQPFTPKSVRSHFQHVFIIIRAHKVNSETRYSLAVSRSKEVPSFGPHFKDGAMFVPGPDFAEFLRTKAINAENAVHRSEKFAAMATRTRQEYMKDLANNYVTSTSLESGSKLSKFSLGSGRKKEKVKTRPIPDMFGKGAIVWNVQAEDFGLSEQLDCYLGISADQVVMIEEKTKEVVFTCKCRSVIGWTSNGVSLRLFYDHGECIAMRTIQSEVNEVAEVVARLEHVSYGCETMEMTLRRNNLGQLGFHVHYEGIVSDVEQFGFTWQSGLRTGCRLVEICKVATSTLTHDQMIDLLRTSVQVKVIVIPANEDGTPRRGIDDPFLGTAGMMLHDPATDDESTSSRSTVRSTASSRHQQPQSLQYYNTPPRSTTSTTTTTSSHHHYLPAGSSSTSLVSHAKQPSQDSAGSRSSGHGSERGSGGGGGGSGGGGGQQAQPQEDRRFDTMSSEGFFSSDDRSGVGGVTVTGGGSGGDKERERRDAAAATVVKTLGGWSGKVTIYPAYNRDNTQASMSPRTNTGSSSASSGTWPHEHSATSTSSSVPTSDQHFISTAYVGGGSSGNQQHGGPKTSTPAAPSSSYSSRPTVGGSTPVGAFSSPGSVPRKVVTATVAGINYGLSPRNVDAAGGGGGGGSNSNLTGSGDLGAVVHASGGKTASEHYAKEEHRNVNNISPAGRSRQVAFSQQRGRHLQENSPRSNSPGRHHNHSGGSRPNASDENLSSGSSTSARHQQRSTAQPLLHRRGLLAQSSTFQEDLKRLIDPDVSFTESDPDKSQRVPGSIRGRSGRRGLQRTLSDESMCGGGKYPHQRPDQQEVIFTTAIPAQVLPPKPPQRSHTGPDQDAREHRLSPRATTDSGVGGKQFVLPPSSSSGSDRGGGGNLAASNPALPLPDPSARLDWDSLLDTANKAFSGGHSGGGSDLSGGKALSVGEELHDVSTAGGGGGDARPGAGLKTSKSTELARRSERHPTLPSSRSAQANWWTSSGGGERGGGEGDGGSRIQQLEERCAALEQQLRQESEEKSVLEAEVEQLRQENEHLQEESQTAAAQLRRFTEWFFQTIDRQ